MEATEVETLVLVGQALREQAAMAEAMRVQVEVEVLPIGGETKILQSKTLKMIKCKYHDATKRKLVLYRAMLKNVFSVLFYSNLP